MKQKKKHNTTSLTRNQYCTRKLQTLKDVYCTDSNETDNKCEVNGNQSINTYTDKNDKNP